MTSSNTLSPLSVKMTPDQHGLVRSYARELGVTLSDFARARMLAVPDANVVYRSNQTRKLMKQMIGQIGRVGNNMNQIAWKLNSGMVLDPLDRKLHEEGVEALKQMRGVLVSHLLKPPSPC